MYDYFGNLWDRVKECRVIVIIRASSVLDCLSSIATILNEERADTLHKDVSLERLLDFLLVLKQVYARTLCAFNSWLLRSSVKGRRLLFIRHKLLRMSLL